MRGIVTLAAAFALPENFPYRDLMLLTAFAVVLGSLVIQGLTLRPLIAALRLKDENPVTSEVAHARAVAYRAALDEIDGDPSEAAEILRLEYRALLLRAEERWRRRQRRTAGRPVAPPRNSAPRGNRSSSCGNPRKSATTRFTSSRKSSTGRN